MSELLAEQQRLPIGSVGHASLGWWGALCLIATEASLFAYGLFAYFYFAVQLDGNWWPTQSPSFAVSLPSIIILILSSVAIGWGDRGARLGIQRQVLVGFGAALALGCVFLLLQLVEWGRQPFTLRSSGYGSAYFTLNGLHIAHLIGGLIMLLLLLLWSALGYFDALRNAPLLIGAVIWHFIVVMGVAIFVTFYIAPYLWGSPWH